MSDRSATVEVLTRRVEQLAAGDPDSTRLVYAMVLALLVVGLLLVLLAVWMIRRTRTDLALLAPLERMSEAKWRKSDPDGRRALLDEVRPAGATPPAWPRPQDRATAAELPPPESAGQLEEPVGPMGEPVGEPVGDPVIDPLGLGVPDPTQLHEPSGAAEPDPLVEPEPDPSTAPDAAPDDVSVER